VRVRNGATSGFVCADAVRFVYTGAAPPPPAQLIVDNADGAARVQVVGTWTASKFAAGYWPTNYLQDGNSGKGTKSVTFRPDLPQAGLYDVYLWYPTQPGGYNWSSNTPVDIAGSTLTNTVTVNQKINSATWVLLGNAAFDSGTNGYVRVRNAGTTGFVCADAVRWIYTGPAAPAPLAGAAMPEAEAVVESWPRVWASGSYGAEYGPENLTDGNTNTIWIGNADTNGWQVGVDYGRAAPLGKPRVWFLDPGWSNAAVLGSATGLEWYDALTATNSTPDCRYLMIRMWADPAEPGLPAIREVERDMRDP
jgi:hypothetical protein